MSKVLKTLIKLNKNKLQEISLELSKLNAEKIRLHNLKEEKDQEINAEIIKYEKTPYAYMLNVYLDTSRKIIKSFQAKITITEDKIQVVRIKLGEQYAELKKFEIALENFIKEKSRKAQQLETKELNEYAIKRFHHNIDL